MCFLSASFLKFRSHLKREVVLETFLLVNKIILCNSKLQDTKSYISLNFFSIFLLVPLQSNGDENDRILWRLFKKVLQKNFRWRRRFKARPETHRTGKPDRFSVLVCVRIFFRYPSKYRNKTKNGICLRPSAKDQGIT